MHYGFFREDGKEYIIENAATPRPWINYLYNPLYFSTISNNGGGISYAGTPLHGRITRYRINDPPFDRPGKFLYMRDDETGEYWSLTWQPVGRDLQSYRVRHGFGYTVAESRVSLIEATALFFVPVRHPLEVWDVRLCNTSRRKRRLSLFGYVEFCLGHALIDLINQCDDQHFNRVFFSKPLNCLFATKTYWVTRSAGTQQQENQSWDRWAYFASDRPVAAYETMRDRFLGPYRNETCPIGVETATLSNSDTDFGNTAGVLKVELDLAAGESTSIRFNLGVLPKVSDRRPPRSIPAVFLSEKGAAGALSRVQASWSRFLGHVRVETPDAATNTFLNYWTPYQAKVACDVGRVASFYYWGIGRGFGFRDTAQDILAITIGDPDKSRERIGMLARHIFRDGRVHHHFYGDEGESTGHCDDPLWFILAVSEYVLETGDFAILEKNESFVDGPPGSIRMHLEAVVSFAENRLGPHGLPVFGRGDWNDTLDYIGGEDGGESVWGGMFYAVMLNRLADLARVCGWGSFAARCETLRDRFRDAVRTQCWDGAWYIRAFGSGGRTIGSRKCTYGKIFLNTQSWAVIARVDSAERLQKAMDSVRRHLDTPHGPKICAPAYREIDPRIGLVTRCVPGKKENGAVFLHPTVWAIQAECMLGHGNAAYAYYHKLLPCAIDPDIFQAEPYVYSQYITSDEHPTAGMASHSWQTGTAAWMFRVGIDYMLGVRPDFEGLRIDPSVPSAWKSFRVERLFRGTRYVIDFQNPDGVEHGVQKMNVDGTETAENRVPITKRRTCRVTVLMGKKKR